MARRLWFMSPDLDRGSVRSSADLNDEIRAFWQRLDGRTPTAVERGEYEALVTAWAAAVRAEVAEAA